MRSGISFVLVGVAGCLGLASGCDSVRVGAAIPVPGPIKPSVGASVGLSGVRAHAGVGGNVGPVPVHVGGSTKEVGLPKPVFSKDPNYKRPDKSSKDPGDRPRRK